MTTATRLRCAARLAACVLSWVICGAAWTATAQEPTLSPNLQITLIKKILSYDRAIHGKPIKIAIMNGEEAVSADVLEWIKKLKSVGIEAFRLKPDESHAAGLEETVALYAFASVKSQAYKELCIRLKLLSFTTDVSLVEQGHAAVGLGLTKEGTPGLVVNLARMRAEGHDLAAELLILTKVIR